MNKHATLKPHGLGKGVLPPAVSWPQIACLLLAVLVLCGGGQVAASVEQPIPMPVLVPQCSVTAGSSAINFDSRSRGQLQTTAGGMTPGTRTLQIAANCTLSQIIKLRLSGAGHGREFSWGSPDSILRIQVVEAQIDGEPVQLQKLNSAGSPQGQAALSFALSPGDTLVAMRQGLPMEGRQLSITLELVPVLGEQDSRPVKRIYPQTALNITLVK